MDVVLHYADEYVLDGAYTRAQTLLLHALESKAFVGLAGDGVALRAVLEHFGREEVWRQFVSLSALTAFFGLILYFTTATASYFFVYDRAQEKHPRYLKNQVQKEIALSVSSVFSMALLTGLCFLGEVRGMSRMYDDPAEYGWGYLALSSVLFIVFTDCGIYWIHRGLHHRWVYATLHKPHHRWIIPTPYAAYAFHPLDGFMQSIPYHAFVYLFPMNKYLYLTLFSLVNLWTVLIHDGEYVVKNPFINSSAHHAVHHLQFNYNYGQYFTFWDRVGGSYRDPPQSLYDRERGAVTSSAWQEQAKDVDRYDPEAKGKAE